MKSIPITSIHLGPEVEQLVLEVLRSGMIAQGPMVKRLEDEFGALTGVDHVVAVNNGTTALIAALDVLDLEPGDEVVTSPFTFVATLNAILSAGAIARFGDISADDFNLDPTTVADVASPRTKVLLPVHLFGQCADMTQLAALAEAENWRLVEDAAQSHGATQHGRTAGTWGIGCFSLYATKNLTSAEGGLITTSDPTIADRLRVLRNQGMRQRYQYEIAGNNYRLTDLQAAVCLPQLSTYDAQVAARQRNAAALSRGLADLPGLKTPAALENRRHVWHQYTVIVSEAARLDRDALADLLIAEGVGCGVYYPRPVYDYDCYRDHPRVVIPDTPVAVDVTKRCLSLPVHAQLSESDLDRIVSTVRRLLEG
jgi:dTDP-4-amino-4,6-dideoxygalactose transaminase